MSELSENTIEIWYGGCGELLRPDEIWLKAENVNGNEGTVLLADLITFLNPPKAEKGPRLFPGTPPTWEQLCGSPTFVDVDGARWLVSARDDYKTTPRWRDIKVFAAEPAQNKGNYYLSWNVKGAVFATGREFDLLKGHRPELLAAVTSLLLKVNWPK
jgi:hypothetical protein